jgi:uncharacterized repeat protein (TIGR01451 family)
MTTRPTPPSGRSKARYVARVARTAVSLQIAACGAAVAMILGICAGAPGTADAATGGGWTATDVSTPTNFAPGEGGGYVVTVTNTSGRPTDGSTITVTDTLPSGITPTGITGTRALSEGFEELTCQAAPQPQCSYNGVLAAGDSLLIKVPVDIGTGLPPSLTSAVEVSGGGAAPTTVNQGTSITTTAATFGTPSGGFRVATSTVQAGAHPDITTVTSLTSAFHRGINSVEVLPLQNLKDVEVALPPGLIANPDAVPKCTPAELIGTGGLNWGGCPPDTQIGLATVDFIGTYGFKTAAVYNMTTEPGQPARFGFYPLLTPVFIVPHVRSDGDYGATASLANIAEDLPILDSIVTLWGVPSAPAHDSARMARVNEFLEPVFGAPSETPPLAFTSNPSSCAGPLRAGLAIDGWQAIGSFAHAEEATLPAIEGCGDLSFYPSLSVRPDTTVANSPAGYSVELNVPQSQDPAGLSTSTLRDATVALPAGTVISPSAADGLQSCSDDPASPAGDQFGLHSLTPASCPPASQIGTVEVHSPLLSSPLEGQVFLGQPNCGAGGCTPTDAHNGNMIRLFLQVRGSGVIVKLEGHGSIDQSTGQLTTSFRENPQLPFDDLKLTLKGGARAPLANPTNCGAASTTSDLRPWSSPFTPDATPSSSFEVTGCAAAQFAPGFAAGATNNRAGAFSPFTTTITRSDRDQALGGVSVSTPAGLLGVLKSVTQCPEPQAPVGACPASSQIGHAIVGAGPGAQPLYLPQAGRREDPVFLTGPYKGAPFGLTILDHAEAGPFNLGDIVVRAAVKVDPHTARITIVSDPLPSIRDGVPLALRAIRVVVDRAGFIFNPTHCEPLAAEGTLTSTQGTAAALAAHFQAADCASLSFHPVFTAAAQGKTSKRDGASLHVHLATGEGPRASSQTPAEANIAKVKVQLPLALPSRLSTLQKACTAAQFQSNAAACPEGSFVGTATAHTPLLSAPLAGPAILVSHGGEAFPDLVIVLQGEGIRIDLTGQTQIIKGITYSKFETVPDAPVTSFDLALPEGRHSVLAAVKNLCATKTITVKRRVTQRSHGRTVRALKNVKQRIIEPLLMPTTITAQNGASTHQTTHIQITGCTKPKAHKTSKHGKRR